MDEFWEIVDQQGWNDQSVINVLLGYIANQQDDAALVEHARTVAQLENGG